ncbi:wax ester synthase/diacylglycerol acyltransferase 11-like [Rutidosis leptorrhynchoides]|uniref:wax ester synthase/diacylglycerol acyltransferase 11-like n=1 Tax=Rutidosis leptorrhynchoides TaxID=125765 RepID=UPI003A996049
MTINNDEPLTPAGRLFTQPATHQIINCALGLDRPIEYDAVRTVVSNSLMIKHPRFSSLLVTDNQGREFWRKIDIDIDRHIILHPHPFGEVNDNETAINDYLADLAVSTPLNTDKPLWEIHLLPAHKCLVLRVHHALGDGISLMSLMLTLCRKLDDPEQTPTIEPLISSSISKRRELRTIDKIMRFLKMIWFTLIYMFEFTMRVAWMKDERTVVGGGEGVEMWPRKLATAKFSIDDMRTVKNSVANATINDVLFGVISLGLSKYLDHRSPDSIEDGLQITGVVLVNLRPSPGLQDMKELMKKNAGSGWGNKFGIMLLPVYYHKNGSDPLQYLRRAKMMLDRKKLSLEAFLSYQIGYFVMKYIGAKYASLLNYKVVCNTSFTVSNIVGPREEFTIAGIPVTYIRTTSSSLSHGITMHMVSYAGKADMQILVAKDLIPDPENLAECFEDALLEMKEAVV